MQRTRALSRLTAGEQSVLDAMAAGLDNAAIAEHLTLSVRTIEHRIGSIFCKLDLASSDRVHRRVAAVLVALGDAA